MSGHRKGDVNADSKRHSSAEAHRIHELRSSAELQTNEAGDNIAARLSIQDWRELAQLTNGLIEQYAALERRFAEAFDAPDLQRHIEGLEEQLRTAQEGRDGISVAQYDEALQRAHDLQEQFGAMERERDGWKASAILNAKNCERIEEQFEALRAAAAAALRVSEDMGGNPYDWEDKMRRILRDALAASNPAKEPCPKCDGAPSEIQAECAMCGGAGVVVSNQESMPDGKA